MKNIILSLLFVFAFSLMANAHAPKKIIAAYDGSKQTVSLTIPHKVKDTKTHYIDKIIITVGEEEITKTYTEQSSLASHQVKIELDKAPAKGTTISIYAKCNKLGSKKTEIIVE